jgi:type II secretory pathway pseudopilin PulG
MKSLGQGGERGYAMAALLVAMTIAAIMMTVALPVWKQMEQREREEELVFRGQQYVRALRLFSQKYANSSPPSLDILVEQRFIRKKFKDPITNDDFQPILAGQAIPGASTGASGATGATGARGGTGSSPFGSGIGRSGSTSQPATAGRGATGPGGVSAIGTPGAGATGGIMGVVSKSKDKSIRLYNGRSHYNEWAFINVPQQQAPGAGAPGTATPGQRGGTGQQGNPFGTGIGGQRGRGTNPNQPPGGGRGFGPGTSPSQPGQSPFQPGQSPFQPVQPIQPGRGRG